MSSRVLDMSCPCHVPSGEPQDNGTCLGHVLMLVLSFMDFWTRNARTFPTKDVAYVSYTQDYQSQSSQSLFSTSTENFYELSECFMLITL